MTAPYTYPTAEMMQAQIAGNRGLRGTATQIDTSVLTAPQALGGFRGLRRWLAVTIAGADAGNVLFPPQQPLQPIAQPFDAGALGRPWDYPVGYNTRVTPRSGLPVTFAMLKQLATYDVLRIMLERVKEEICSQDWTIGPEDKKATRDARCDEVAEFLEYPDKDRNWGDWLKLLLDQMLIYDAPAIWLRPTRGGDLYGLEILDGSLISPKILPDGRLPPPELGPAYQQVLKGLPAVDYIRPVRKGQPVPVDPDGQPFPELLYKPRTPRVDSVYGFSPVEQIIATVNIALRREDYLLAYYTDGNVPDLLFGVPDTWNPNQIEQMQRYWDSIMSGNLQNRRKGQFIPGGVKPFDIREKALTDETDQWLVRVMCFCLGLSPLPFIKMMNRAVGETHAEQQKTEGIEPHLHWVRDLMNYVIEWKFGYDDIVFRWEQEDSSDPLEQAQRYKIYLDGKVYHPDEVRQKLGDDAMPPDMRAQMDEPTFSNALNASVLPPDQQGAKPAPEVADKLGKGRGSGRSTRAAPLY